MHDNKNDIVIKKEDNTPWRRRGCWWWGYWGCRGCWWTLLMIMLRRLGSPQKWGETSWGIPYYSWLAVLDTGYDCWQLVQTGTQETHQPAAAAGWYKYCYIRGLEEEVVLTVTVLLLMLEEVVLLLVDGYQAPFRFQMMLTLWFWGMRLVLKGVAGCC